MTIGSSNNELTNATLYYYSANEPDDEGNFWYYDKDGKITIWENKKESSDK